MARIEFNRIKINLITLLIYINNVYKVDTKRVHRHQHQYQHLTYTSRAACTQAVNVKWNTKNHTSSDVQINTI